MGEYTGLHLKCKVKKEFREIIRLISEKSNDYYWENVGIDFIDEYAKDDRSHWIPHGALSYMPDSWDKHDGEINFNKETGEWEFWCSLKNYANTIENFFNNVLSRIVESIEYCEVHYNGSEYSTLYTLNESGVFSDIGSNEVTVYDRPIICPYDYQLLYPDD